MPLPEPAAPQRAEDVLLTVVVPMLNEERGIGPLLTRLVPVLEKLASRYEIIAVDDGSTDATFPVLAAHNARNPAVKALRLSRNFGKEIAVAAGLRHARGDAVIVMDADLQHPPEVIPQFYARWRDGFDVVFGQRLDRAADSPLRRHLSGIFYRTFHTLSGTKLHENAGDFRLLSRRAVIALNRLGERSRFNKGLFAWIGFPSTGVPFSVPERAGHEASRWRMRRLWRFALDGIASFTTIPLRIWSYVGVAISMLALVFGLYIIAQTMLYGSRVAGFPTLIVSVLFLGGIQLISLGIIGEYLGRVYEEVKARPLYLVGGSVGLDPIEPEALAAQSTSTPRATP